MKTADLQRSKRLKELGWEQESHFVWSNRQRESLAGLVNNWEVIEKGFDDDYGYCDALTAGEMIEWLLGKNFIVIFGQFGVYLEFEGRKINCFSGQYGNENALADACAWVLAKAIEGQEIV